MQVQHIGHSIRNAADTDRKSPTFFPNSALITAKLVFIAPNAGVNADLSGQVLFGSNLQTCPRISRIFHRHPRMLQEQPLLRVDVFGFLRWNIEEHRIKLIDGNEAAPFAVMMATLAAIFAEIFPPVPALFGNLHDAVLSLAQVPPIRSDTGCSRIAPAQSNNRYAIDFCFGLWCSNPGTGKTVAGN